MTEGFSLVSAKGLEMKKKDLMPAPMCPKGKHNLLKTQEPWYGECEHCGERFALISETVLKAMGVEIASRELQKGSA